MKINISLIQFHAKSNQYEDNLGKAVKYIEQAFQKGSKCVLLQEMWASGYQEKISIKSIEFTSLAINTLSKLSKEYKSIIVAGSLLENNNGKPPYNTCFIMGPNGQILTSYRKMHLFPGMGEDKKYSSGNELCIFDLFGMKAGVIICYDLRFPEEIRALADKGIDILFVPAMWPDIRKKHWVTLLKARAIENQFYVLGSNAVGNDCNIEFAGNSAIIDPEGEIQELIENKEGLLAYNIDMKKIESIRKSMPILESKRKDLYKKWNVEC